MRGERQAFRTAEVGLDGRPRWATEKLLRALWSRRRPPSRPNASACNPKTCTSVLWDGVREWRRSNPAKEGADTRRGARATAGRRYPRTSSGRCRGLSAQRYSLPPARRALQSRRVQPRGSLGIEQQRRHHARIERRLTKPAFVARHDLRQIQVLPRQSHDQVRQMVRRHIIDERRWQKLCLINFPRTKMSAHDPNGIKFVPKNATTTRTRSELLEIGCLGASSRSGLSTRAKGARNQQCMLRQRCGMGLPLRKLI